MGAGNEAAFDWKSSGESWYVTARDGENCGERLNGHNWRELSGIDEIRRVV